MLATATARSFFPEVVASASPDLSLVQPDRVRARAKMVNNKRVDFRRNQGKYGCVTNYSLDEISSVAGSPRGGQVKSLFALTAVPKVCPRLA
jgi:hypothetical protein